MAVVLGQRTRRLSQPVWNALQSTICCARAGGMAGQAGSLSARGVRNWPPHSITTDKLGSYPKAIGRPRHEGKVPPDTKYRKSKYLNNIIEADHGGLKRVILPTPRFSDDENSVGHPQGI